MKGSNFTVHIYVCTVLGTHHIKDILLNKKNLKYQKFQQLNLKIHRL